MTLRVVLDANIIVSGILSPRGAPGRVLELWRNGSLELILSEFILAELDRVLQYPKVQRRHGFSRQEIRALLSNLRSSARVTPGELRIEPICDDPFDDPYLECAIEGKADCIVTGDDDLLRLAQFEGIPIIRANDILMRIQG